MKKLIAVAALATALTGCSTMHFTTNAPMTRAPEMSEWHHNAAFSLLEVSAPVNMKQRCSGDGFQIVTTQQSLVNGLAGSVDTLFAAGLDLWTPWSVSYVCNN